MPPIRHAARSSRRSSTALLLVFANAAAYGAQPGDLTQLSLEQLLDVKVIGASKYEQTQREVAAAVNVITRAEIAAFGWRTLGEALASLPGIYTTYDRQYHYLGTRGFSVPGDYNTRLLVAINGNRANDIIADGGSLGLQAPIDIDLVERIEFIPGPGGAVYGQNAMFGVINVVTRSGKDMGGAEASAGWKHPQRTGDARLSWGGRLDNGLDLLVSASAMRSRGEDRFYDYGDAGVSGVAAGLDGGRDKEFFFRAARGAWSYDFAWSHLVKDDPSGAYLSDPLVPGQYQADRFLVSQLQYQDSMADGKLDVLARAYVGQGHYASRLYYGTGYDFPTHGHFDGVELRLLSLALADHKLMVGVEAMRTSRLEQTALDVEQPANDVVIIGSRRRTGLYVQDEWQLGKALSATLGMRVDRNNVTGTTTSPRAALIWQAAESSTVKALYGRAHRAPNAYESDYDDGFAQIANPALRGERIDTLEFVVDHRVGRDLALRAAAYQWTIDDVVTLGIDPVSGIPQYQSGATVKARGLELSADKTWAGGARVRGSVSAQRTADDAGVLPNSPRLLGRLNATVPLPWWGLRAGYEWRYDSARLTLDGSSVGGHALSSLVLSSGALAPGLDLSLRVDNLFDKRYAHPGADSNWQNAFDQDGRSLRVQATYRF